MPTVSLGSSLSTSMRLSSVSRVLRVACGLTGDDATTGNDAPALSRANVGMRNCSIYRPHPYRRSLCHLGFCLPIRLPSFHISLYFPPFIFLITALLNDGTIMTLSVDRVLPSMALDSWESAEIFIYDPLRLFSLLSSWRSTSRTSLVWCIPQD
ncbi:hypothetical protein K435DRAFT_164330 [Dendrothele bispora CBS 962.96]|uniref:Uncharacterized protein n=1 Tax=Dendrothele bispora (strain CBS 962.96) TaxID=1314807 RepID=A0A4S8LXF0_DENBC|nr:hypothetical protein K435DRAFT_164330 [Dendrothele bispora CBS 962.96]